MHLGKAWRFGYIARNDTGDSTAPCELHGDEWDLGVASESPMLDTDGHLKMH